MEFLYFSIPSALNNTKVRFYLIDFNSHPASEENKKLRIDIQCVFSAKSIVQSSKSLLGALLVRLDSQLSAIVFA